MEVTVATKEAEHQGNEVLEGHLDHQDNVLQLAHQTFELHIHEELSKSTSSEVEHSALQINIEFGDDAHGPVNNEDSSALPSAASSFISTIQQPVSAGTFSDNSKGASKSAAELDAKYEKQVMGGDWVNNTMDPLEWMLNEVVGSLQPTEDDYLRRQYVIQHLSHLVQSLDICQGADVVPFGSFESNFYTPWGDLDLSVELPFVGDWAPVLSKSKKVKVLRGIERALAKSGAARMLHVIGHARVPLLMFVDVEVDIACDVSVDNGSALFKSRVLRWVTNMDPRCRQLIFLVKCWAKAQCINDPKLGTLNSYAICLLVVFHLQTRTPPILPPFSAVLADEMGLIVAGRLCREKQKERLDGCYEKIQALIGEGYGQDNKSSLGQLFLSFFTQFASVKSLWSKGLAVSTFRGEWEDSSTTNPAWKEKNYPMRIEDPFDLMDNCARSIQDFSLPIICETFVSTAEALSQIPDWNKLSSLREVLFCWPPGTPRPGVHFRQFPIADPSTWKSRAEYRAERKQQQQTKQPRREGKSTPGKVKVDELSSPSENSICTVMSIKGGETRQNFLEESRGQGCPETQALEPDQGDVGLLCMADKVAGKPEPLQGLTTSEEAMLVLSQSKRPELAGLSGAKEEKKVKKKKTSKKFNKASDSERMGAEQWGQSAERWAQSRPLMDLTVSGEAGTASTTSDLVIDPTNSGSFLKEKKREQTWKSLVSGESLHDRPQSSGVEKPDLNTDVRQPHQLHHEHPGENPETLAPGRAEPIHAKNYAQFSKASQTSVRGPQRGCKDSPPDVKDLGSPRKPRYRSRKYKRPVKEGMVQTSPRAPAAGRSENPQKAVDLAGRQGILRPDVFVGDPLEQQN